MGEDDAFYMAVQNPRDFRRELLGSSKSIIQLIQHYEQIKDIREKKIKKMHEFSAALSEVNMIMNKLKKAIPTTRLKKLHSQLKTKQKKEKKKASKPSSDQIERLQREYGFDLLLQFCGE